MFTCYIYLLPVRKIEIPYVVCLSLFLPYNEDQLNDRWYLVLVLALVLVLVLGS